MTLEISRKHTLLFDLSDLNEDIRELTLPAARVKAGYLAMWSSRETTRMIQYYWYEPTYEDERYVTKLNSGHWIEYQLIKHLPIKQIIDFFLNQTNRDAKYEP